WTAAWAPRSEGTGGRCEGRPGIPAARRRLESRFISASRGRASGILVIVDFFAPTISPGVNPGEGLFGRGGAARVRRTDIFNIARSISDPILRSRPKSFRVGGLWSDRRRQGD